MGAIILPRKWNDKPPMGVQIDRGHPLADRLWHCMLLNEQSLYPRDLVTNQLFSPTGNPTIISTRWGTGIRTTGSTDVIGNSSLPAIGASTALSCFVMAEVENNTVARKRAIRGADTVGTLYGIDFSDDAGQMIAGMIRYDASNFESAQVAGYSANQLYKVGFTWRAGDYVRLFVDGVAYSSGSTRAALGGDGTKLMLGNSGSGFPLNGKLYLAYVWNRQLQQNEMQQLVENPFVFFWCRRKYWFGLETSLFKTVSDAGAGSDAIAIGVRFSVSESGHGADGLGSLGAKVPVSDTGTGMDTPKITVQIRIAETGQGADAISVLTALLKTVSDVGYGTDAPKISVSLSVPETGHGADAPVVSASLTISDIGRGQDAISILAALFKTVSDLGSGADSLKVSVSLSIPDAGHGTDAPAISVAFKVSDTGHGEDAISILVAIIKTVADAGIGVDSLKVSASVSIPDTGQGTDVPGVSVALTVPETGHGEDALSVLIAVFKTVADIGQGVDSLTISAWVPVSDAGHGTDAIGLVSVILKIMESGHGFDSVIITVIGATVTATFSGKKPRTEFTGKKPYGGFGGKKPGVDFEPLN